MPWSPDYVTAAELKAYVRIDDTADDAQIALSVTAASRAVDRSTGRQFGLLAAPAARFYTARYDSLRCRWVVTIDDLMTSAGLAVAYDTLDDGTYTGVIDKFALQPANAAADSRPWTRLVVHPTSATKPGPRENGVRVTAQFGWTPTWPTVVKQATLLQASRFLARRDSPYGIAGSPEMGSEQRLLAKLDPDVALMLRDVSRTKVLVA